MGRAKKNGCRAVLGFRGSVAVGYPQVWHLALAAARDLAHSASMADHSGDADLLTAAEERELAYRIEVGALAWAERHAPVRRTDATAAELLALERDGRLARQRFVQSNLGLVVGLVRGSVARTGLPRDELFQEGCLGLMIAVARFDHRRGLRFSTYAVPWIRARLGEAVQRRGGGSSLPAAGVGRLREARAAEDELVQALGRDATPAEVAARAGLDQRGYERLLAWQRIGSLDDGAEPGRLTDAGPAPEEVADRSEWTADRLLWHLTPVEQAVLRQRFGLPDDGPTGAVPTGAVPTGAGPTGAGPTGAGPIGDVPTGDVLARSGLRGCGPAAEMQGDGPAEGRETSFAAIARRLGVSVSSVRRIEARALRRLREVCADEAGRMTA